MLIFYLLRNNSEINNNGLILARVKRTKDENDKPIPEDKQRWRSALLLPIDITVVKKGEKNPPKDGVIVKKGDTITIKFNNSSPDNFLPKEKLVWQWRQLKGDGKYTEWKDFGAHGKGHTFDHTIQSAGIFQIKCVVDINGNKEEYTYNRKQDVFLRWPSKSGQISVLA